MSCVEIYAFGRDGTARLAGTVHNAWLGAVAVWTILEERYLPPLRPDRYVEHPSRVTAGIAAGGEESLEEIFRLFDDSRVSRGERMCLGVTFDDVLVRREDIPELIEAMRSFAPGESTNLPEQAKLLEELIKDRDVIAVGWAQNDISCPGWDVRGEPDPETGNGTPYNCLTGDKHIWLDRELAGE